MGAAQTGDATRVLVVDDEDALRQAYERILRASGMTVVGCRAAEQVVELLRGGERYDVIVTDLVMTGMNGTDLLPVIRQFDGEVPIVIITGQPTLRSSIAAVENGSFKYLLKPVSSRDLTKTVRDAAARHRLASLKRRALEVCENEGWQSSSGSNLEENFESALRQMYMAYQPIVDSQGALYGHEALVRTLDPVLPSPDQLFHVAERLGRVQELGRKIRLQVSLDAARAPKESMIFVNLHASDLGDPELYAPESALSRLASRVVLEITERKSLDGTPDVQGKIAQLRALDYRIAVDDLGAGYAGLACVNQLDPDIVKFDMSLIRDVDTAPRKLSLIRSMLQVCQSELAMEVVCEGVETDAERESLMGVGATLLQGYLLGRPQRDFVPEGAHAVSGHFRVATQPRVATVQAK
ncbi:MAG: EAL domain-containing protein [Polyangiaceae bacterium]